MSYYNLIPERVKVLTSVSTKKTQIFINNLGKYKYHHIKNSLYNGFVVLKDENQQTFHIATAERAVIDCFYFKCSYLKSDDATIFENNFRSQHVEQLNKRKLQLIVEEFNSIKLKE